MSRSAEKPHLDWFLATYHFLRKRNESATYYVGDRAELHVITPDLSTQAPSSHNFTSQVSTVGTGLPDVIVSLKKQQICPTGSVSVSASTQDTIQDAYLYVYNSQGVYVTAIYWSSSCTGDVCTQWAGTLMGFDIESLPAGSYQACVKANRSDGMTYYSTVKSFAVNGNQTTLLGFSLTTLTQPTVGPNLGFVHKSA